MDSRNSISINFNQDLYRWIVKMVEWSVTIGDRNITTCLYCACDITFCLVNRHIYIISERKICRYSRRKGTSRTVKVNRFNKLAFKHYRLPALAEQYISRIISFEMSPLDKDILAVEHLGTLHSCIFHIFGSLYLTACKKLKFGDIRGYYC